MLQGFNTKKVQHTAFKKCNVKNWNNDDDIVVFQIKRRLSGLKLQNVSNWNESQKKYSPSRSPLSSEIPLFLEKLAKPWPSEYSLYNTEPNSLNKRARISLMLSGQAHVSQGLDCH